MNLACETRLTLGQPAVNTRARYNVCPSTTSDIIVGPDNKRELVRMRWVSSVVVVEAAQGNEARHIQRAGGNCRDKAHVPVGVQA
jgi:putative SOS response-associated peptidase YedK